MAYIAEKYAMALIKIGQEEKNLDRLGLSFDIFLEILEKNAELKHIFVSPNFPKDREIRVLDEVFEDRVERSFLSFLKLLVERHRESLIYKINEEFKKICDMIYGREKVEVFSAYPLSIEQNSRIKEKISSLTGKKIEILNHTDESLLGGAVFKIGDKVIDASILSKINQIRKGAELAKAR